MNILITGANRGIGLEIVWQYLRIEEGPNLIATCRNPEAAEALRRMKGENPERLKVFALNQDDPASVAACLDKVSSQVEALDVLINNAAINHSVGWEDAQPEDMLADYRTNVAGPLLVTRRLVPLLEKADAPKVIMISSGAGSMEIVGSVDISMYPYCTSKAALNMLGVMLAKDLKSKNIGVYLQSPGWVKTDMGGQDADLTPNQSVSSMMKIWDKLTIEDTGKFYDYQGSILPW